MGRKRVKSTSLVTGNHTTMGGVYEIRSLIRSERSLIGLLRTALFNRALRCTPQRSLLHSRAHEKNNHVYELGAPISYSFYPLYIATLFTARCRDGKADYFHEFRIRRYVVCLLVSTLRIRRYVIKFLPCVILRCGSRCSIFRYVESDADFAKVLDQLFRRLEDSALRVDERLEVEVDGGEDVGVGEVGARSRVHQNRVSSRHCSNLWLRNAEKMKRRRKCPSQCMGPSIALVCSPVYWFSSRTIDHNCTRIEILTLSIVNCIDIIPHSSGEKRHGT